MPTRGEGVDVAAIQARHERDNRPHPADVKWEGTWEWQLIQDRAALLDLVMAWHRTLRMARTTMFGLAEMYPDLKRSEVRKAALDSFDAALARVKEEEKA